MTLPVHGALRPAQRIKWCAALSVTGHVAMTFYNICAALRPKALTSHSAVRRTWKAAFELDTKVVSIAKLCEVTTGGYTP